MRGVGELLGLTCAESDLELLFVQGKMVREVALATGCGETTVRWHVRQIFVKPGLSRQVELGQLVSSVADFMGIGR